MEKLRGQFWYTIIIYLLGSKLLRGVLHCLEQPCWHRIHIVKGALALPQLRHQCPQSSRVLPEHHWVLGLPVTFRPRPGAPSTSGQHCRMSFPLRAPGFGRRQSQPADMYLVISAISPADSETRVSTISVAPLSALWTPFKMRATASVACPSCLLSSSLNGKRTSMIQSTNTVMAIYQLYMVINGIIHSINGVISTYNW